MKVFARKQQPQTLSVLKAAPVNTSTTAFEVNSGIVRHSFNGWQPTNPNASRPKFSIAKPVFRTLKLSVLEVMRVNHATIREGESHRVWPSAVVQKFRTAEVITDRKAQHYQLSEASLRKL